MAGSYVQPVSGSTTANPYRPKSTGNVSNYSLSGAHEVYLDGRLLPQTPSKITYEYPDQSETIRLANQGNFTIPRWDAPITVSFDFVCTTQKYPFTWDTDYERKRWTDFLWQIKQDRRPINFAVWRYADNENEGGTFNVSMRVLLTDWSFVEDAEQDNDFTISVKLMEYFPQNNLEINEDVQHHLIQNRRVRGWAERGRGFI